MRCRRLSHAFFTTELRERGGKRGGERGMKENNGDELEEDLRKDEGRRREATLHGTHTGVGQAASPIVPSPSVRHTVTPEHFLGSIRCTWFTTMWRVPRLRRYQKAPDVSGPPPACKHVVRAVLLTWWVVRSGQISLGRVVKRNSLQRVTECGLRTTCHRWSIAVRTVHGGGNAAFRLALIPPHGPRT